MAYRGFLGPVAVIAALAITADALAAEVTDVADAVDVIELGDLRKEDPFDLYFGPEMSFEWHSGKITREPIDRPGITGSCTEASARQCLPVDELRYNYNKHQIKLRMEVGMFHDLAFVLGFPIVFQNNTSFRYADDVGPTNSTVDNGDPTSPGFLFENNFQAFHAGPGPLEMGLRWAPLNDERDRSKPAWMMQFLWEMPWTAKTFNPETRATQGNKGSVGDGVHRLKISTALSKRVADFGLIGISADANRRGYTEPYMLFRYIVPLPSPQAQFPLKHDDRTNPFGHAPSHEANLDFGVEIIPYEDLMNSRKIGVDLGVRTAFFSEGRNYSLLTDPLGELTFTEQYFHVSGLIGLYAQAAEFIRIKASVGIGYGSEHFLTFENVGEDGSGDGQVLPTDPQDQLNPFFQCNPDSGAGSCQPGEDSYDQIGFRFKQEETLIIKVLASIWVTF